MSQIEDVTVECGSNIPADWTGIYREWVQTLQFSTLPLYAVKHMRKHLGASPRARTNLVPVRVTESRVQAVILVPVPRRPMLLIIPIARYHAEHTVLLYS